MWIIQRNKKKFKTFLIFLLTNKIECAIIYKNSEIHEQQIFKLYMGYNIWCIEVLIEPWKLNSVIRYISNSVNKVLPAL